MKRAVVGLCVVAMLAACGQQSSGTGAGTSNVNPLPDTLPNALHHKATSTTPIQHIVIIVQENRSFDNMFNGFPGADTVQAGKSSTGQTIPLQKINLAVTYDPSHSHRAFEVEYDNGKMDGFDKEKIDQGTGAPTDFAYAYVDPSQIQPYWTMAQQYALADHMFATNESSSGPAHLYLVAGNSATDNTNTWYALDNPVLPGEVHAGGCDSLTGTTIELINPSTGALQSPGPFPCFDRQVIFDLLDPAGVTWKWYEPRLGRGLWFAPDWYSHIRYGPDYANVSAPSTNIFTDISNNALPNVSWVIPTCTVSDHPNCSGSGGPAWVASVVNAIGQSPYWSSTAIFITWDEWGGWYDHVRPYKYNRFELGFRVPFIVVSPYARAGYISHYQHEFGSMLHYIESTFGLGSLNTTDARADALGDMFDYTQTPINFVPIPAPSVSPAALFDTRSPGNDDTDG
jgi:phospholipase C